MMRGRHRTMRRRQRTISNLSKLLTLCLKVIEAKGGRTKYVCLMYPSFLNTFMPDRKIYVSGYLNSVSLRFGKVWKGLEGVSGSILDLSVCLSVGVYRIFLAMTV